MLIPKLFYTLFPKMEFEDYTILKQDEMFRKKTTQVCELCYLDITKYCDMLAETNKKFPTLETSGIRPIVNNSSKINVWNQTMSLKKMNLIKSTIENNNCVNDYIRNTQNKIKIQNLKRANHSPKISIKQKNNISNVSNLPKISYKPKNTEQEKKVVIIFTEDVNRSTKDND